MRIAAMLITSCLLSVGCQTMSLTEKYCDCIDRINDRYPTPIDDCYHVEFDLQRIGPIIVKGMDHAEQVFELDVDPSRKNRQLVRQYELALRLIENRQFDEARKILVNVQRDGGATDSRIQFLKSQLESLQVTAATEPIAFRLTGN